jgi:hypothetical protein
MELSAAPQLKVFQPWVVQQDGAPPHWGYWMQRFQTYELRGTIQHHGHHVHRTLPLWTFLWFQILTL